MPPLFHNLPRGTHVTVAGATTNGWFKFRSAGPCRTSLGCAHRRHGIHVHVLVLGGEGNGHGCRFRACFARDSGTDERVVLSVGRHACKNQLLVAHRTDKLSQPSIVGSQFQSACTATATVTATGIRQWAIPHERATHTRRACRDGCHFFTALRLQCHGVVSGRHWDLVVAGAAVTYTGPHLVLREQTQRFGCHCANGDFVESVVGDVYQGATFHALVRINLERHVDHGRTHARQDATGVRRGTGRFHVATGPGRQPAHGLCHLPRRVTGTQHAVRTDRPTDRPPRSTQPLRWTPRTCVSTSFASNSHSCSRRRTAGPSTVGKRYPHRCTKSCTAANESDGQATVNVTDTGSVPPRSLRAGCPAGSFAVTAHPPKSGRNSRQTRTRAVWAST